MAPVTGNESTQMSGVPFSLEAEQSVLGAILVKSECIETVLNILKPDYFYLPQHKSIFSSMITMFTGGSGNIDPVVLADVLTKEGVYDKTGGREYLLKLSQSVPSVANVESYARIVRDKYYLRTLITIAGEISENAVSENGTAEQILDNAEQQIYNLRQGKETTGPAKLSEIIVNEVYDKLTKLTSPEKDQFKGISSGFSTLDDYTTGLNKSDLILIGARPAMGKTSFALNLARNVSVLARKKILFFSLEMSKMQLAERILASDARIESQKMRTGELTEDEWLRLAAATQLLSDVEFYIDDTASITVPEMKSRIRRLKNVDAIFIDYLGLMQSGKRTENRVQEVSEITRGLKMLAKDMNIPVICCAQLSRATEVKGKSHKPQLADLRESGSIEQDADIVMFLYREVYYKNEKDPEEAEQVDANATELIIAKNRHGKTGSVKLHFESEYTLFSVLDEEEI